MSVSASAMSECCGCQKETDVLDAITAAGWRPIQTATEGPARPSLRASTYIYGQLDMRSLPLSRSVCSERLSSLLSSSRTR